MHNMHIMCKYTPLLTRYRDPLGLLSYRLGLYSLYLSFSVYIYIYISTAAAAGAVHFEAESRGHFDPSKVRSSFSNYVVPEIPYYVTEILLSNLARGLYIFVRLPLTDSLLLLPLQRLADVVAI